MAVREISLRERALAMLARREHTRAEMARKLSPHSESPQQVEQLLDALVARGWLSEARFAESRANTLSRKFGSRKIEYDLRSRGVSDEVVERSVLQARISELENCRSAWQRKFGTLPQNAAERGRQMRFLAGRGFSAEVVRQVLKAGDSD
ncbi:MAG: recombination regulator RecX [Burkholderiales bacterium]|nr:recombination regulator RecX [Burkholderiales bacterium]